MEDFLKMTRKQLQKLCKKHGVPANLKNAEMAERLSLCINKDGEALEEERSGELENAEVEVKKKVRFSPENGVHEVVDMSMKAVVKEKAESKRGRVTRSGFRKNGLTLTNIDERSAGELESTSHETEHVKVKKTVRFSPENNVYEFVDTYTEAVEQEQAEARRVRATRRRGVRNNGLTLTKTDEHIAVGNAGYESEEILSKQVRVTRSRKSIVIVSPPLKKRVKTGGKAASEAREKESRRNSGIVDSVKTDAGSVKEFDGTFVVRNDVTSGSVCTIAEVNSLDSVPIVEIISAAEVPRRTRTLRKLKGDDTSMMEFDDGIRPVIKNNVLTGQKNTVHAEAPQRKSSRVAMKNVSNMPRKQKRKSAGVLEKGEKRRLKNEFPVVILDSDEEITLAREGEEKVSQIKDDCMLGLRCKLSAPISSFVAVLDVDSGREHQKTCGSSGLELPLVEPLQRSKHKKDGYEALGLADVNSLPTDSHLINRPLKQTITDETESCLEAITTNLTRNCSKSDLLEDPGQLPKKFGCAEKHHKFRKRPAILGKGVSNSKSVKSCLGRNDLRNKTDVSELKDVNSNCLVSITEVVNIDTCSANCSDVHDELVEASILTNAALQVKESTISTVEDASVINPTKSSSVPAVGESLITACDSALLQIETLTTDPFQRGHGFEEPDNLSEFSNSFSHSFSHVGCNGDEVSTEEGERHVVVNNKHAYETSVPSDTRISKRVRTEGVPELDASNLEEAEIVPYKSPTKGKDVCEVTNDWPITKEVVSKDDACGKRWGNMPMKQNMVDDDFKEISSGGSENSTEARFAFQNEESIMQSRSYKDKVIGGQDRTGIKECQLILYTSGSEFVKNLRGDTKKYETTSDDLSLSNKQDQCFTPLNAEGNPDGNCKLELVRATPEHGPTSNVLYHDKRRNERVSDDQSHQTNALKLDGVINIRAKLDPEEVPAFQLSDHQPQYHPQGVDSTVYLSSRMDVNPSEVEVFSSEAGSVSSQRDSLSHIVVTDHLAGEPKQDLDNETDDSLLYFASMPLTDDAGMALTVASKKEFAQDGHDAYTDEVCTTLHATDAEADHSENIVTAHAALASSDSSFTIRESLADRNAETKDAVDYPTLAHSSSSAEYFTVDRGIQNPIDDGQVMGHDISKEITSEYREMTGLPLFFSENTQPKEIIASCSLKTPSRNLTNISVPLEEASCTDTLSKLTCPGNVIAYHATASSEDAIDESIVGDCSISNREGELNTSRGNKVKQTITEVLHRVEDYKAIPEMEYKQTHCAPGGLDNAEESPMDFVSSHDTDFSSKQSDSEAVENSVYKTETVIGDLMTVDLDAFEENGLKNCTGSKETFTSKDICISFTDVGTAKGSTSCVEFPSFDKLDGLLREIDDYFEWRNSEERVMVESSTCDDDSKEKDLNSNVETYFEVPIKTDYGRNVSMNESIHIAGIDVEVYAAPCKGQGEHVHDVAACDEVAGLITKDSQPDHHEGILTERCSNEHGLSGFVNVKSFVNSPTGIQTSPNESICTGSKVISSAKKTREISSHQSISDVQDPLKPAAPSETTAGLLASAGANALTLKKNVHHSTEQKANSNSVNNDNKSQGIMSVLNPQILSSSNLEAEISDSSHGLANQETTSLETNSTLDTHLLNTVHQQLPNAMKENITPFSKTEPMKRPKTVSNIRRRVLDSLQNN